MSRHLDLVRSFLEQLEARDHREGAILAREFSVIKASSVAWKTEGVYSTKAGSRHGNTRKNRYKDVVPYDETRVILSLLQEEGHGDYINASFIRVRLVILMACQETENGKRKCERYWAREREPLQVGPFCITLTKEAALNSDITLRTLQVTFQKESRCVHQLQYMSWPDHGVPSSSDHILTMVEEARCLRGLGPGPLCVHCSAGCGRTGVLCATIPPNFSLFEVVLEMRKQRPAAVQTEVVLARSAHSLGQREAFLPSRPPLLNDPSPQQEQYRFLYHTVAQLFSRTLQNTSPHYQNLKENYAPICKEASSVRTSSALPATSRPPGGVLRRSISVPAPPTLPMADTYAVVQKRGAPAGTGPGTRASNSTDAPIYSQVAPRVQRPVAHTENAQGTSALSRVPVDQNHSGPDAYEEVTDGALTGRLGFNLRIGRPKGPRDPPAEWTRV
ncbi:Tyrosine-protein phosphatase non-receptor type 18 [Apodemus speciosus]|uniref:protein-tyrosine-phosphatase n=1 Tax=Apodemus speciosus TaxID=105296 RepID=A0ABQ0ECM2_APOSI